jgi:AraC-like DNA-binding protein
LKPVGGPDLLPPAVATLPTRDTCPRLPLLADQIDVLESCLRHGCYGTWSVEPTCDGAGFAVEAAREDSYLASECIRLGDGAWLVTGNIRLPLAVAIWGRNRGGFMIDVAVRGGWQAVYAHAPTDFVTVPSGYGSVSVLGPDTVSAWVPFVDIANEYVCVLFRDEAAMRAFGLTPSDLAAVVGELAIRQATKGRTFVIEPNADMLCAARAIRQAPHYGASRFLYRKAKACELLANLGASRRVPNPGSEIHARPAADDASVAALAVSAMGDCTTALDLRVLARQLGLTENRLVRAFKTVYGTTPFGYANRARVARGRTMLLHGHMSLIEIALACGYEHHSSFTTAYRRTYGETPRETRLHARRSVDQGSIALSARAPRSPIQAASQLA